MTKQWQDLQTIDDFIESCKEDVRRYRNGLSKIDKENIAGAILSLTFSDHFDDWFEDYPIIEEIQALTSDLEWSNSSDISGDWEKLQDCIARLEREVNEANNQT